jgi:hypothetical protein
VAPEIFASGGSDASSITITSSGFTVCRVKEASVAAK